MVNNSFPLHTLIPQTGNCENEETKIKFAKILHRHGSQNFNNCS